MLRGPRRASTLFRTILNQKKSRSKPSGDLPSFERGENLSLKSGLRRFRERIEGLRQCIGLRVVPGMRATRTAGLGASAQRLVHDLLDRASTAAAFGTAPEAAVYLPGRTRHGSARTHRIADVVIGDDVAGTDDHGGRNTLANAYSDISANGAAQKENGQFQAIPNLGEITVVC